MWSDWDAEVDRIPDGWCDGYTEHSEHTYRAINGLTYLCRGITAAELAELEARALLTCDHGMSLELCAGPGHYA